MPERGTVGRACRREGKCFFHDHQESEPRLIFRRMKTRKNRPPCRWQSQLSTTCPVARRRSVLREATFPPLRSNFLALFGEIYQHWAASKFQQHSLCSHPVQNSSVDRKSLIAVARNTSIVSTVPRLYSAVDLHLFMQQCNARRLR